MSGSGRGVQATSQAYSLLCQLHWRCQERKQDLRTGFEGVSSLAVLAPTLSTGPWLCINAFSLSSQANFYSILGPLCRMRQVQTGMVAVAAASTSLFWVVGEAVSRQGFSV